jgi:hypothetical protein
MQVRKPSHEALVYLVNVGMNLNAKSTVEFGCLAYATDVQKDIKAYFDIQRLKSKRTFVFARAGYGKSNLIKYLLSRLYQSPPDVGLLIFDPEGEYALPNKVGNKIIPGLASLPELRSRMAYYTLRGAPKGYEDIYKGGIKVNFSDFTAREILVAFVPSEKHDQVWANWIKGLWQDKWLKLLNLLHEKRYYTPENEIAEIIGIKSDKQKENVSVSAIRNNLISPIDRLHDPKSTLAKNLIEELKNGKIYVVDISLLSSEDGLAVAELLMEKIFYHNVKALSGDSTTTKARTLVVLEEAQAILGGKSMSDKSIFVRWVKEGRKYDLGAILITQQPGAIANEILSQGDNFFVMHLLNQNDLDVLRRVNSHFAPDILEHIRNEPIKGNCFFWSAPDQPYVISAKVRNFDLVAESSMKRKSTTEKSQEPSKQLVWNSLHQACVDTINKDDGVWVFRIKGKKSLLVFREYFRICLSRRLLDLSIEDMNKAVEELNWRTEYMAKLTDEGGLERVIIFPPDDWNPKDDKKLRREVKVEK